jgi:hypothetical protein
MTWLGRVNWVLGTIITLTVIVIAASGHGHRIPAYAAWGTVAIGVTGAVQAARGFARARRGSR